MSNSLSRIKDLLTEEKQKPFFSSIDLFGIEEDFLIGVSGQMAVGFSVEGRDLLLEGESEINDFEQRMRRFLNHLPEEVEIHFIVQSRTGDEGILKEYRTNVTVSDLLAQKISDAKVEGYRLNPFQQRRIFIYVTASFLDAQKTSLMMPDLAMAFGKKAHKLSEEILAKSKDRLLKAAQEIQKGLEDLKFTLVRLRDHEILEYHHELLNPSYSDLVARPQESVLKPDMNESLRSKLLLSPPFVDERFFYLDGYFHKGINLRLCPDETDLRSMRNFEIALGREYTISLSFSSPDQDREKAGIQRRGNFAKAGGFFSKSKNHEAHHQAEQSSELLAEIAETEDRLFNVSLGVMVKAKTQESVSELALQVLRAFPKLGDARGLEDHMNHDRLFLSMLPLQGADNPLSFLIRSEALVHLLPLQASWKGTEKPGLLLRTWRDEALKLDIFDPALQAKHALMLGSTGSGKSFFTNHLLLHFLVESQDHEVIVMDVGGSYRKLARILNGNYVELECSGEYVLNPFPIKRILFPTNDADATFLQFLKELLQQMIGPERVWSASEKMILERAVREVYRLLKPDETPILGDVEKLLLDYPFGDSDDKRKAYQFAKELSLFTLGEYGKLLNQRGSFDFDARFTVFDLRKVSDYPELQEILLLIIPFALKRRFENVGTKKMLVLDECWRFLKEAQGSDLIENFYRTARKMNAGVLSISQNPEDFLDSKISGVMINNSSVKYILRLKKGHEKLQGFGLNENEIRAISEIEVKPGHYAECFIKFDEHGVLVRLSPNPLEYWISTTDPQDLAEESKQRAVLRSGSEIALIEHLASEYPNGIKKTVPAGAAA
ncbi:MAG TPA: ATP-binding protein [Candidatus Omnitrophota bacterium]|nr:ATP-binding protein [Candidatus Omnitrophota bacterium]